MSHLAMLVIFYVDVISCQDFNLPHIYHIFVLKTHFLRWKFTNYSHGIQTWFILCEMTWFNILITFIETQNHLNCFWNIFVFLSTKVHYIRFHRIYSNLPLYKMKWFFFLNLLPRLYSNIICKKIMKIFQKFEVGYTQTCTSLESSTMWHPKGRHYSVLSPHIKFKLCCFC
jgi:hypothetical protein